MSISNYDLGNKIASIRLGLGLSQEQFAERIGNITDSSTITKGTVNNWEHGRNKPNKSRLLAIAKISNRTVDNLINDEYDFKGWEDATGYTEERIKEEIKKSSRINKNDDPQTQISKAVNNMEGRGQTDVGAINSVETAIRSIENILNDYYIDPKKKEKFTDNSSGLRVMKPHSLESVTYDDMTPQAYKDIIDILNNARYAVDELKSKYHR